MTDPTNPPSPPATPWSGPANPYAPAPEATDTGRTPGRCRRMMIGPGAFAVFAYRWAGLTEPEPPTFVRARTDHRGDPARPYVVEFHRRDRHGEATTAFARYNTPARALEAWKRLRVKYARSRTVHVLGSARRHPRHADT